jgi:hypothetical protein
MNNAKGKGKRQKAKGKRQKAEGNRPLPRSFFILHSTLIRHVLRMMALRDVGGHSMSGQASEALGSFRADLRRVETTLGARFEARVAASEAFLRDEILKEIRGLREEMALFRTELTEHLRLRNCGILSG